MTASGQNEARASAMHKTVTHSLFMARWFIACMAACVPPVSLLMASPYIVRESGNATLKSLAARPLAVVEGTVAAITFLACVGVVSVLHHRTLKAIGAQGTTEGKALMPSPSPQRGASLSRAAWAVLLAGTALPLPLLLLGVRPPIIGLIGIMIPIGAVLCTITAQIRLRSAAEVLGAGVQPPR